MFVWLFFFICFVLLCFVFLGFCFVFCCFWFCFVFLCFFFLFCIFFFFFFFFFGGGGGIEGCSSFVLFDCFFCFFFVVFFFNYEQYGVHTLDFKSGKSEFSYWAYISAYQCFFFLFLFLSWSCGLSRQNISLVIKPEVSTTTTLEQNFMGTFKILRFVCF